MKGIALDTNIVIDILNGKKEIAEICFKYYPMYLPITVCGELLFGAINSAKSQKNLSICQEFIDECQILNTTSNISMDYAKIRKHLKDLGHPIPENDIWIAAICRSFDITLATRDKHFSYIPEFNIKLIE
jgi:tRNA(fMet)-specific endonuclease VapC